MSYFEAKIYRFLIRVPPVQSYLVELICPIFLLSNNCIKTLGRESLLVLTYSSFYNLTPAISRVLIG